MRKIILMMAIACLLSSFDAGKSIYAAVGVPENIVLYRDFDPSQGFPQIFIQKRYSTDNFLTMDDPVQDFLQSTGAGGSGDLLNIADVNGDGTDDLMVVQDATAFGKHWLTIAGFSVPGPPLVATGPGTNNANRADGDTSTNPLVDITVITRRDFDGDSLADTAVVLDGNVNFSSDVLLWSFRGSQDGSMVSAPLNGAGVTYSSAAGFGGNDVFGASIGLGSIPLVGDFNGDGKADRAISNDAFLLSGGTIDGRQIQIDLSPSTFGDMGDGLADNASAVLGIANTDVLHAADINGDGLDDIVAVREFDLDDGNGNITEVYQTNGYINNGIFDGSTPTFDYDANYDSFTGLRNLGDTVHFGAFGFLDLTTSFDPADLNEDGFVDGLDLGILLGSWGQETTADMGELDGSPPVDGLDLGILLGAWNPPPAAAVAAVPEPTSIVMLGLASLVVISMRRDSRS